MSTRRPEAALAAAGGQGTVTMTQHAHNVVPFPPPTQRPVHGWRRERSPRSRRTRSCTRPSLPHLGRRVLATETDEEGDLRRGRPNWRLRERPLPSVVRRVRQQQERRPARHQQLQPDRQRRLDVVVHVADETTMNANGVITVNFPTSRFTAGLDEISPEGRAAGLAACPSFQAKRRISMVESTRPRTRIYRSSRTSSWCCAGNPLGSERQTDDTARATVW